MLPLPLIWKMKKLNRREKFALTGMLLFGVITITVSTSRFTMMSLNYWNHETCKEFTAQPRWESSHSKQS